MFDRTLHRFKQLGQKFRSLFPLRRILRDGLSQRFLAFKNGASFFVVFLFFHTRELTPQIPGRNQNFFLGYIVPPLLLPPLLLLLSTLVRYRFLKILFKRADFQKIGVTQLFKFLPLWIFIISPDRPGDQIPGFQINVFEWNHELTRDFLHQRIRFFQ